MKSLLAVLLLVVATSATGIDWKNVKPIEQPAIMSNLPAWRKTGERIAGGEEATPHQFPFQVKI